MSNIGRLKKTDLSWELAHAFPPRRIATILATLLFSIVLISFRPFSAVTQDTTGGGDLVNQLGFSFVAVLSIFSLIAYVDRRVAAALLSPWWLILLAFLALSVVDALDPASAVRAAFFTVIGILAVATVLALPRDAESFSFTFAFSGLAVLGLCYVGLVIFPDAAKHGADSIEPQHAGFWRGIYSHKNVTGPVMGMLVFAGFYLFRRGWRWTGGMIFVLAMIYLAQTGSKTTTALAPLSILVVAAPGLLGMRFLTPILFLTMIIAAGAATIGSIFIPGVPEALKFLSDDFDTSFTGRTSIWEFGAEMLAQRPWTGYGLESFWTTTNVTSQLPSFDQEWDVRGIVHGHNSYLDIALTMGLPALLFSLIAFIIVPVIDYFNVPKRRESILLADFFMMIIFFICLTALLESFFFRRADPVWMSLVFGLLGMRLVARFPIRS